VSLHPAPAAPRGPRTVLRIGTARRFPAPQGLRALPDVHGPGARRTAPASLRAAATAPSAEAA
jgi:hypothetical protein